MEKNLLNNFIFYHLDSIEQNLSIYEKDKNPVCLHLLRVEIKKIRAIFSFAENIYHEKYVATKAEAVISKSRKITGDAFTHSLVKCNTAPPRKTYYPTKRKKIF
ncbi:MAG: hypothetical protein IPN29_02850 [Saprospiraceae bacterium]|nr:hypothetical protein [Saprospiraceae bacterium]